VFTVREIYEENLKMRIFISWSGTTSKALAEVLRIWLPAVIQAVRPYYTPADIEKGARWSTEIANELEASQIGIICLTPDNLKSAWIMFEAGALAKNLGRAKVCPLLFGLDFSQVEGPLLQFQAAKFEKGDIKRLVRMINAELGDDALDIDVLDKVFELWWPQLQESAMRALKEHVSSNPAPTRTDRELIEEMLVIVRALPQLGLRSDQVRPRLSNRVLNDLAETYCEMIQEIIDTDAIAPLYNWLKSIGTSIADILESHSDHLPEYTRLRAMVQETNAALSDLITGPRDEPQAGLMGG
jgi:TIR domain